ncbi:MFS transporter [Kineococcus rhizosphaerae]|uniref:MFS transporter n=1 Tax=Kineococcus rhizosphaerae TaxID=559628 RepID=UPI001473DF89|nr:MFS transporter [Kineococcus rhizosphaerae]
MNATSAAPGNAVGRRRWSHVGALLLITYLVAYVDRTNMSVAAPSMREELGLSGAQMGTLLSAFFWGYVASLAIAGVVVTRLGPKKSLVTALLVFGLASSATGLTHDFGQLIAVRAVLGLGEGLVFPAITILLIRWFPSGERGRASGLALLAIPISAVLMAPSGGWLIENWDYRTMFVVQGIPPLIVAVFAAVLLKADPSLDRGLSASERSYILSTRDSETRKEAPAGAARAVYLNWRLWLLAVTYLLWMTGLYGFNQWLPTVLSEASGLGMLSIGWITAIPFVGAAIAMALVARGSDRSTGGRTAYVALPILLAGLALAGQRLAEGFALEVAFLVVAAVGLHAAFGPWWPFVLRDVSPEHTGYASSLVLSVGNLGGVIGPIIVGHFAGTTGSGDGFTVLGYAAVVAAGLALLTGFLRSRAQTRSAGASAATETADVLNPVTRS